jgi:hypothetical protein
MNITTIQIAQWLESDRERKIRLERRQQFYARVRKEVLFLAGVALIALTFAYRQEIQNYASTVMLTAVNKNSTDSQMRQGAAGYKKQADQVTQ